MVAPTQELVTQVVGVAKSLCATAPLRVAAFTGQGGKWSQREMLEEVRGCGWGGVGVGEGVSESRDKRGVQREQGWIAVACCGRWHPGH